MSKRFELVNFLNAHDKFRDHKNNKELDSFDVIRILNHYEDVLTDWSGKISRLEANKELLESVKLELLEFVKRHNGIIYGMIPEQVMAEQIEKCISEKIKMLGENK